jgi:hypothetical protein
VGISQLGRKTLADGRSSTLDKITMQTLRNHRVLLVEINGQVKSPDNAMLGVEECCKSVVRLEEIREWNRLQARH